MAMQTPKDLFIHELGDILDAEQKISKMLPTMAKECNNPEVKNAFEHHHQETLQQITNLEQCFNILGIQPEKSTCQAVAGMKHEHDSFLKEQPSEDLITMYDLGGAEKTEYYEIASYKGLIEMANLMGQTEVAQLLQQNLKQEESMSKKVQKLSKQLSEQLIGQGSK